MTRRIIAMIGCALLAVILGTAPSWSDRKAEDPVDPSTTEEPTTGKPSTPTPGDETPFVPFEPYSIGPEAEAAWPYKSLTVDEQAQVDRGRSQPGWDATNAAFAGAARERSVSAKAEAAAIQLGIDGLEIGVVP